MKGQEQLLTVGEKKCVLLLRRRPPNMDTRQMQARLQYEASWRKDLNGISLTFE